MFPYTKKSTSRKSLQSKKKINIILPNFVGTAIRFNFAACFRFQNDGIPFCSLWRYVTESNTHPSGTPAKDLKWLSQLIWNLPEANFSGMQMIFKKCHLHLCLQMTVSTRYNLLPGIYFTLGTWFWDKCFKCILNYNVPAKNIISLYIYLKLKNNKYNKWH